MPSKPKSKLKAAPKVSFEVDSKTYADFQLWASVKHPGRKVGPVARIVFEEVAKKGAALRRRVS